MQLHKLAAIRSVSQHLALAAILSLQAPALFLHRSEFDLEFLISSHTATLSNPHPPYVAHYANVVKGLVPRHAEVNSYTTNPLAVAQSMTPRL
jgi:hypothetical protein